jgi:hypothetical protein
VSFLYGVGRRVADRASFMQPFDTPSLRMMELRYVFASTPSPLAGTLASS